MVVIDSEACKACIRKHCKVLPGVSTESLVEFERKFWESVPDIHKFPAHLILFECPEEGEYLDA